MKRGEALWQGLSCLVRVLMGLGVWFLLALLIVLVNKLSGPHKVVFGF